MIFPVFYFAFLDKPVILTNLVHPTTKLLAMNTEPSVAVVLTKAMHRTPNTEHRTPNTEHRTPNSELRIRIRGDYEQVTPCPNIFIYL